MQGDKLTLHKLFQFPVNAAERLAGKTFVGIDFGTSTTVVSVASYDAATQAVACETLNLPQMLRDGTLTENQLLPTVMAYTGKTLLVGDGAYQLKGNPDYVFGENLWHSFKMELGIDMGPKWTSLTRYSKIKSPQQATAIFFKYLKMQTERMVKRNGWSEDIQYAVSIPASFESNQRLDLLKALEQNGIDMHRHTLIDEPNAAFIGYIHPDYSYKEPIVLPEGYNPKVLVFDFGAGTCDISILELSADYLGYHTRNISISQFTELGGNDIDRHIASDFLLPYLLESNGKKADEYSTPQLQVIVNQLMGIAEQLKIRCCKDFEYLLTDRESLDLSVDNRKGVKLEVELEIETDNGPLKQTVFPLRYEEFIQVMRDFFKSSGSPSGPLKRQKKYNCILTIIESAIQKAKIKKEQVDYVMMVGGSSKNPFVQRELWRYFPKSTRFLIPQDLQALVSQGAAIHSLLTNGLGTSILRPITSERIIAVTRGEREETLIPAGVEIPFKGDKEYRFTTGDQEQHIIEIPICVSNAQKMVAKILIESPDGEVFPRNTEIRLALEMDADKVLKVAASYEGGACCVSSENPFANTYLTDDDRKILEAERQTYLSADANAGTPSKQSLIDLRKAYEEADRTLEAAETYEQQLHYYPQADVFNYVGVLFGNAGNYTKAIYYYRAAIKEEPNHPQAWSNLGIDLYNTGNYKEAKKCMTKALELRANNTTALIILGDMCREEGDSEQADTYYQQAYHLFNRRWMAHTLEEADYGWFRRLARTMGKHDLANQISEAWPQHSHDDLYDAKNLVDFNRNKEEDL